MPVIETTSAILFTTNITVTLNAHSSNPLHTCVCIYKPLDTSKPLHKVNFLVEFNRFKIKVFLFLDRLPNQNLHYDLPIAGGRNSWIHTFPRVLAL